MQQTQKAGNHIEHFRREWLFRLLRLAVLIGAAVVLSPSIRAADHREMEGASGVLHVRGALTESACRLDMTSSLQDVWWGQSGTRQLQRVGDMGAPVTVHLMLRDCLRSAPGYSHGHSGNLLWGASQPSVSVSVLAPTDAESPNLIALKGGSGLALRLTDEAQHDIRLDGRGAPMQLAPGQNELTFSVTPGRTKTPLKAGVHWAQMHLRLTYD